MKTSAYQKRQAATSKRAEKSRRRRIKNAAAVNAERLRRIRLRNKHQCGNHDQPMLSAAGIRYEVATRNVATCYGGIGLAHAMARRSALADTIDRNVELLQSHFPYHESEHAWKTLNGTHRRSVSERTRRKTNSGCVDGRRFLSTIPKQTRHRLPAHCHR